MTWIMFEFNVDPLLVKSKRQYFFIFLDISKKFRLIKTIDKNMILGGPKSCRMVRVQMTPNFWLIRALTSYMQCNFGGLAMGWRSRFVHVVI